MKDELSGQIMKIFVGLQPKTFIYLKENNEEKKRQKVQKSVS